MKHTSIGKLQHLSNNKILASLITIILSIRLRISGDNIINDNLFGLLSIDELAEFPRYVRFNSVIFDLHCFDSSIEEMCKVAQSILKNLTCEHMIDSSLLFGCIIAEAPSAFNNHAMVLDYIAKEFLPIFNRCRSYIFTIRFYPNSTEDAVNEFIASILQFSPISCCSDVSIILSYSEPMRLPVDAIFAWLDGQSTDGVVKKQNTRTASESHLRIFAKNSNAMDVANRIEKVSSLAGL